MQTAAPQAPENGHPHAPQDGQTQVPQDQWQQWWQQQWWQEQWSLGLPKKTINNFNQVYVTKLAKLVCNGLEAKVLYFIDGSIAG